MFAILLFFIDIEKCVFLGKARTIYVNQCKNKNVSEDKAISVFEKQISDYLSLLSPQEHKVFLDNYIKGIKETN